MYLFSFLLASGAILGLSWAVVSVKAKQAVWLIDVSLLLLAVSLLGSRAIFVLYHWDYYQAHLLESLQVWKGGLSGVGALAGGLLAWVLISFWQSHKLESTADHFLPLLMLVSGAAWLGCWLEGVAYGPRMEVGGWSPLSVDEWGILGRRFPTQLLGALLTLSWFWLLNSWQKPKGFLLGWLPAWGFLGVAAIFTALTFLRADSMPVWRGLRMDTWGGIILLSCSIIYLFLYWSIKRK